MNLRNKLLLPLLLSVSGCASVTPCPVCALPPKCPAPPQLPALSPIPPEVLESSSVRKLDLWLEKQSGLMCSKAS